MTHSQTTRRFAILLMALSLSLLLLGGIWVFLGSGILAASLQDETLPDPNFQAITVTASFPSYDVYPGQGITKTVFFSNGIAGVISLTFEISGTPTLTFTPGVAFGFSPTQVITDASSFTTLVTYTVLPADRDFYDIDYMVTNRNGITNTIAISYVRDITAPLVSITPMSAGVFTGTTLLITGTAEDNPGGVGVQSVVVDTEDAGTWVMATGTTTWAYTPVVSLLDGAAYTISAKAIDHLNSQSLITTTVITVDNATSNPTTLASSVPTGTWTNTTHLLFTWSQVVDYSDPISYFYALSTTTPYTITNMDAFTGSEGVTLSVGSTGIYSFYLRTKDSVGNWADHTLALGPFKIDLTSPNVWDPAIENFGSVHLYVNGTQLYHASKAAVFRILGRAADTESDLERVSFSTAFGDSPLDVTSGFPGWHSDYSIEAGSLESGIISATVHDKVGNTTVQTYTYTLDTQAPTGSVTIDSGALYVSQLPVLLTFSANDAGCGMDEMCFGDNATSCNTWQPYQTTRPFALTEPDGMKTIYVWYRDYLDNESGPYTDTILLDRAAPTGTLTIDEGAHTNQVDINLTLEATDPPVGSGVTEMRLRQAGGSWQAWEPYATTRAWTLTGADGNKTIEVQYRDAAENESALFSDTILLDRTEPTGTITIDEGTQTNQVDINLTLEAIDPGVGSGVTEMRLRQVGSSWQAWEAYATTRAWTLTGADGEKTIEVQYRDAVGNESAFFSDTILLDRTAPTGTITIDEGTQTNQVDINLTLEATGAGMGSGITEMRLRQAGSSWQAWEPYATTRAWTLTGADGNKTIEVQYRDAVGNESAFFSDTILLDRTAPIGNISIDEGTQTNQADINLTLEAIDPGVGSGVTEMRLRQAGSSWQAWEPYATTRAWTLTGSDGDKTIEVQYRDAVSNQSVPFSDTILLDRAAPIGDITIDEGDHTNQVHINLTLAATDPAAGSGVTEMRLRQAGSSWQAWEPYATTRAWTLTGSDGNKTIEVQYRDAVGNESAFFSDTILLDRTEPTGDITIDEGAYTNSATVHLTLEATDPNSGSGISEMRLRQAGNSWNPWEPFATTTTWTVTGADGDKIIEVQYRDAAGNESDIYDDITFLDRVDPTGNITIDEGAYTNNTSIHLSLQATDPGASSGVTEMRLRQTAGLWRAWEPYATTYSWTLLGVDGNKTLEVQYRDMAGNESDIFDDTILLDRAAPTGDITIDEGAQTNDVDIHLTLEATDPGLGSGVMEMRLRQVGSIWNPWEPYATTRAWTLTGADGEKMIQVQYRDAAGNPSDIFDDVILLDRTDPEGALVIDEGAHTNQVDINLTLEATDPGTGSGVTEMCLQQDGGGCSWESYTTACSWTLTGEDGEKVIAVQYRDAAGNESAVVSDTILLDRAVPTGDLIIDESPQTNQVDVNLTLNAADPTPGSGVAEMRLRQTGSIWNSWETYATTRAWTLTGDDGEKTIEVQYRDAAGNESEVFDDMLLLDRAAPAGTLSVEEGAITNQTDIQLALTATDPDPGSGSIEMRLRQKEDTWGTWMAFAADLSWNLVGGDGNKTIEVQFRDAVGNESTIVDAVIFLDTVAPTVQITVPARITEESTPIPVQWSAGDPDPSSGTLYYTVAARVDEEPWSIWLTDVVSQSANFSDAELGHTYTFSVTVRDPAGNTDVAQGITHYRWFTVYVPLSQRNYAQLTNGSFENGLSSWKITQDPLPVQVVDSTRDTNPFAGNKVLLLGNPDYICHDVPIGSAEVEQTFMVPDNATRLAFRYIVWSQDASISDGYDRFEVYINDALEFADGNQNNLGLGCSKLWRVPGEENPRDGITSGWALEEIDLEAYRGQSITLSFRNYSRYDNWYNTYTYIDDVRIETD